MVVAEADCTERGKSKVNNNNGILSVSVLVKLKLFNEANVLRSIQILFLDERQIAEDVPDHTHEVANGYNDDDQLEGLEEVRDHQDCHDIIVIQVTIVCEFGLFIDYLLKSCLEKILDMSHECV